MCLLFVSSQDSNGRTPIHYSFAPGQPKRDDECAAMMKCLLEHGADQFIEDHGRLLPVEKALKFHGVRLEIQLKPF